MNYFHGYDLSLTGTGLVVLDDDKKVVASRRLSSSLTGVERLAFISASIEEIIGKYPPTMICQEDYIMNGAGRNPGRAFHIGELGGVVKVLLYSLDLEPILVGPTRLKKYVSGKGNTEKDMMIMYVYKNFGFEAPSNDEADAYGLAHLAHSIYYNTTEGMNEKQLEVIFETCNPTVKPVKEKKRKKKVSIRRK